MSVNTKRLRRLFTLSEKVSAVRVMTSAAE